MELLIDIYLLPWTIFLWLFKWFFSGVLWFTIGAGVVFVVQQLMEKYEISFKRKQPEVGFNDDDYDDYIGV